MDQLSTPPIPEPISATDLRQERAHAPPRQSKKKAQVQDDELETNEQDDPVENGEPKHFVDISV